MKTRLLLGTNISIYQHDNNLFNLDTILLADFTKVPLNSKTVIDYGTGNGCLLLYLSCKTKAKLIGLEVQATKALIAKKNVELNQKEDQIEIVHTCIKDYQPLNEADCIISNPPFFKINDRTLRNENSNQAIARHEVLINLEELIQKAHQDLKFGGVLFMIHRPERLHEIIAILNQNKFYLKTLRFVHPYLDSKPNHVLIEAKHHKKTECVVLPPLILYHAVNQRTEELQSIYEGRTYHAT